MRSISKGKCTDCTSGFGKGQRDRRGSRLERKVSSAALSWTHPALLCSGVSLPGNGAASQGGQPWGKVPLLHILKVSFGSASVSEVEKDMLLPPQDMFFNNFNDLLVSVKGSPSNTQGLSEGMLLVEKPPLWYQSLLAFLLGTRHRGASLGAHSCRVGMREPRERPAVL